MAATPLHANGSMPSLPDGPTGKLCQWIASVTLREIPLEIRTRVKYLILDGIACALVGANLPWSQNATKAFLKMESTGGHSLVIGHAKRVTPLSAALLNSTFIQGFELDDWHKNAPLHSQSLTLPVLFSLIDHVRKRNDEESQQHGPFTGLDFLLATIVGFETGPRIGNAVHGAHMLSRGWHSGAVFGPSTAAATASKLLGLAPNQIEDALGIACTQASGLMSAQFESDAKRMQHGFATRNGLLGALLAEQGYTGIKCVYEREYGGFLNQFSAGNERKPQYLPDEIYKDLGKSWQTDGICVKPYASMAFTHCTIDCVKSLQETHPDRMSKYSEITKIRVELGEAAFHHGGFVAKRPIASIGAQMSSAYCVAVQIICGQVLPAQFSSTELERDDLWQLVELTTCELNPEFTKIWHQRVTITFADGSEIVQYLDKQKGVDPPITNEEIVDKFRAVLDGVIDHERRDKIEQIVLHIEEASDMESLMELLSPVTANPIA